MFKQFINNVNGADVYLITTLILFIVTFLFIIIYLITAGRKHFKEVSEIPLDASDETNSNFLNNINQ